MTHNPKIEGSVAPVGFQGAARLARIEGGWYRGRSQAKGDRTIRLQFNRHDCW